MMVNKKFVFFLVFLFSLTIFLVDFVSADLCGTDDKYCKYGCGTCTTDPDDITGYTTCTCLTGGGTTTTTSCSGSYPNKCGDDCYSTCSSTSTFECDNDDASCVITSCSSGTLCNGECWSCSEGYLGSDCECHHNEESCSGTMCDGKCYTCPSGYSVSCASLNCIYNYDFTVDPKPVTEEGTTSGAVYGKFLTPQVVIYSQCSSSSKDSCRDMSFFKDGKISEKDISIYKNYIGNHIGSWSTPEPAEDTQGSTFLMYWISDPDKLIKPDLYVHQKIRGSWESPSTLKVWWFDFGNSKWIERVVSDNSKILIDDNRVHDGSKRSSDGYNIVLAVVGDEKKDFSSCAFVYSYDGEQYYPEVAISDMSAHKDWELPTFGILNTKKDGNKYTIGVREAVRESQYIDNLNLVKIIHDKNQWVVPEQYNGEFHSFREKRYPISAVDDRGNDYLNNISSNDDLFWTTVDSDDLNFRDGLTLKFDLEKSDKFKIVVRAKEAKIFSKLWLKLLTTIEGVGDHDGYDYLNKHPEIVDKMDEVVKDKIPMRIYQKNIDGEYKLVREMWWGNAEFYHDFSIELNRSGLDSEDLYITMPSFIYQIDEVYADSSVDNLEKISMLEGMITATSLNGDLLDLSNDLARQDGEYLKMDYYDYMYLDYYDFSRELKDSEKETIVVYSNAYAEQYSADNSTYYDEKFPELIFDGNESVYLDLFRECLDDNFEYVVGMKPEKMLNYNTLYENYVTAEFVCYSDSDCYGDATCADDIYGNICVDKDVCEVLNDEYSFSTIKFTDGICCGDNKNEYYKEYNFGDSTSATACCPVFTNCVDSDGNCIDNGEFIGDDYRCVDGHVSNLYGSSEDSAVTVDFVDPTPKDLTYSENSVIDLVANIVEYAVTEVNLNFSDSIENLSLDKLIFASSFDSFENIISFPDWSIYKNQILGLNIGNDEEEGNSDYLKEENSATFNAKYSDSYLYDGTRSVAVGLDKDFSGYYITKATPVKKHTDYVIKVRINNPTKYDGFINVFGTELTNHGIGDQVVASYMLDWKEYTFNWNSEESTKADLRLELYSFDGTSKDFVFMDNFQFIEKSDLTDRIIDGKYDGGLYFDGIDDSVEYGNKIFSFIDGSDISFFTWIKGDYITNQQMIAGVNDDTGGNNLLIGHSSNQNKLGVYSGKTKKWYYSSQPFDTNSWHYFGFTYDDSEEKILFYYDGVLDFESNADIDLDSNQYFSLGMEYDSGFSKGDYFKGGLDEVRMFNRVLSQSDIDFLYATNFKKTKDKEWLYNRKISGLNYQKYQYDINVCDKYACDNDSRIYRRVTDDAKKIVITEIGEPTIENNVVKYKYILENVGQVPISNISLTSDNEDFDLNYNFYNGTGDLISKEKLDNGEFLAFGSNWNWTVDVNLELPATSEYDLADYKGFEGVSDNSKDLYLNYNIKLTFLSDLESLEQKILDFDYGFKCNYDVDDYEIKIGDSNAYSCSCGVFCGNGTVCPCVVKPVSMDIYSVKEDIDFSASGSSFINIFYYWNKFSNLFNLIPFVSALNYEWKLTNGVVLSSVENFQEKFDIPGKYIINLFVSESGSSAARDVGFYVSGENPYCDADSNNAYWIDGITINNVADADIKCNDDDGLNRKQCCPYQYKCNTESGKCSELPDLTIQSCVDYTSEDDCNSDVYNIAEYSIEAKEGTANFCGTIINITDGNFVYGSNCRCKWDNGVCTSSWDQNIYTSEHVSSFNGTCKIVTTNVIGDCSEDDFRIEELTATWSGDDLNRPSSCVDRQVKVDCGSVVSLSFFGWIGFGIAVILISIIYVFRLKKKNNYLIG